MTVSGRGTPLPERGDPEYINYLVVGKAMNASIASRLASALGIGLNTSTNDDREIELRTDNGTHVNKSATARNSGAINTIKEMSGGNFLSAGAFDLPATALRGLSSRITAPKPQPAFKMYDRNLASVGRVAYHKPKPEPPVEEKEATPVQSCQNCKAEKDKGKTCPNCLDKFTNCPWFAVGEKVDYYHSKRQGWKPAEVTDMNRKFVIFRVDGVPKEQKKVAVMVKPFGKTPNIRKLIV